MGDFWQYWRRLLAVAFRGRMGQARAFPFYLSVLAGGAYLMGYQVVLNLPTGVVAACSFLAAVGIGFVWAPYVLYSSEKERADGSDQILSERDKWQRLADGLAQYERWGAQVLNDLQAVGLSAIVNEEYLRWHVGLHDWAKQKLPSAEYARIESVAPFHQPGDVMEGPKEHPITLRLEVMRKLIDQYQNMAHGLR